MDGFSKASFKKIAGIGLGIYIVTYYSLMLLLPSVGQGNLTPLVSDLFTMLGGVVGVFIIYFGLHWLEARNRIEWKLFSLGVGMNLLGDIIWSFYEIVLHKEVPFPSVCDIFYLSGSIFYLVALVFYIRHERLFDIFRAGFDIIITMVVSTTLIFQYIMLPIWADNSLTFAQKFFSMSYPILDLGYLGGIFSLIFFCEKKSKLNKTDLLISTAFSLWFFADILYAVISASSYVSGGIFDPLWPIGSWIIAFAMLFSSKEKGYCEVEKENEVLNRKWLLREYIIFLLPYIGVSLIILLVSYKYILSDPLITGTVITVLLIMVRQVFSLLENRRLITMIHHSNQLLKKNKMELEDQNIHLQELNYLKEKEANTDFLTGIFNRRYIDDTLKAFTKGHASNKHLDIAVLLIDIDHYKEINDNWGHKVGDTVLQQIAFLIKSSIRAEDIAGRFGGDEFIVIMPNADLQVAESIAERLRRRTFEEEFIENGKSLRVTLSIGCTRWNGLSKDYHVSKIIVAADTALYKAKSNGRNQWKVEVLY